MSIARNFAENFYNFNKFYDFMSLSKFNMTEVYHYKGKFLVRLGFAVFIAPASASGSFAATLTVGPGQQFETIAAAVAASQDGDAINVTPGLYMNDFAEITTKITLQAVGKGMARLQATVNIPNEKAILITDTDITITGFEFYGARVTYNQGENGAGIRYQGGNLILNNCYFHDDQDGMLADPDPTGTITITNSEFKHNGDSTGPGSGYTHNLYVGDVALLDIENSYFREANIGHEIKSRAEKTIVRGTRVVDGPTGTASYGIDLPNGGVVEIENDQIEKGPNAQNPIMISYGEEGMAYATNSLLIENNLIENDLHSSPYVQGLKNDSAVVAAVSGNSVYGLTSAQLVSGPATITGTTYLTTEPKISTNPPWR